MMHQSVKMLGDTLGNGVRKGVGGWGVGEGRYFHHISIRAVWAMGQCDSEDGRVHCSGWRI